MKNAIILYGSPNKVEYYKDDFPAPSNNHWLPWLQKQLLIRDILAQTPEMPRPYDPIYSEWCEEFERYKVTSKTILIGHSFGGGFIVRWLNEHPKVKVGKVVLVAPWINPNRYRETDFFDNFELNPHIASQTQGITIFNSDDDTESIQASVKILKENIKSIRCQNFHGYGHFIYKHMKTHEFPELLEEAIA